MNYDEPGVTVQVKLKLMDDFNNFLGLMLVLLNSAFVSYGDLGGCYPPRPTASTDNTLLDLHNSSYDTQPPSLTVK